MRNELVRALLDVDALEYGEFNLASGRKSNYYFNIKKAITDPRVLSIISKKVIENIPTLLCHVDAIAGVEIGGVPIATAVSLDTGIPLIIVRKKSKGYGIGDSFIGDVEGKRIVLVEDVTTTGSSVIKGIEKIRDNCGIVDTVITVADRDEGARHNLGILGVKLIMLVKHSDLRGE
ncbi:MAG: orotate phosphoribosyltransferase [Candidatus Omnitrophica bacterium]|nr:orotate phosphoribosyltransferase [Candidatus Omnitrophota bacterium]